MHEPGIIIRPDLPLAVVVGAGGLGYAVARRLGQAYRILLADRDEVHLGEKVEELRAAGFDAKGLRVDVTRPDDIAALAQEAQRLGPPRALAHVLGLSIAAGDFAAILSVNLVGAAMVAAHFREIMVPGGCAVLISSSSAHMRGITAAELLPLLDAPLAPDCVVSLQHRLGSGATAAEAYSLSKAGLNRLCQRSAASWGEHGLRIVSLSPGLIATPMGAEAYRHSQTKRNMLDAVPLKREGTMPEIAEVVEFLLSDRASFLSGTDILVDGGMVAALGQRRASIS